MTDPEVATPTATSPDKPKRARKPKAAAPKVEKPPRAPVVRVVTAYLAAQSQYHAEAADVLGADFKRDLRDELAVEARYVSLSDRLYMLEDQVRAVTTERGAIVLSKSCRNRLDKFAAQLAEAKGAVPHADDAPTEADLRGVGSV